MDTNKEKYFKYEKRIIITKKQIIGKEIAYVILNMKQSQITIPNFKDKNNIEKEMTYFEA